MLIMLSFAGGSLYYVTQQHWRDYIYQKSFCPEFYTEVFTHSFYLLRHIFKPARHIPVIDFQTQTAVYRLYQHIHGTV